MSADRRQSSHGVRSLCALPRAVSPVVGTITLLVLTVFLVGAIALVLSGWTLGSPPPIAAFELTADSETGQLTFEHTAGDEIDVEDLSLHVTVDGTALEYQPPVPYVGAEGFRGSPEGPFNAQSESTWKTGERASVTLAGTNEPTLESGSTVRVKVAIEGSRVAELESVAE
ncbi:hypothetical protein C483_06772 [Natrialba hulunbeirensis JCM 10989]|uniref:Archaeal Type IV pilin N-terminal domain-containing protein n=1 Tax=Natrialba hulunbeirensis JCM 10989 TaxID=1227493 RepID=M0A239_9EURY|nr:type IV pilin N-terminal domain-containing protein [Natrialba hulunbeirensis]ELY92830.1 hypothetical protein C483_06772 [Natrialba hulunbeirensis JCM 10989]